MRKKVKEKKKVKKSEKEINYYIKRISEEIAEFIKSEILTEKNKKYLKKLAIEYLSDKNPNYKKNPDKYVGIVIEKFLNKNNAAFKSENFILSIITKYKKILKQIYSDNYYEERVYLAYLYLLSEEILKSLGVFAHKNKVRVKIFVSNYFYSKSQNFKKVIEKIFFIVYQVLLDFFKEERMINVSFFSTNIGMSVTEYDTLKAIIINFVGYVLLFHNQLHTRKFKTFIRSGFRKNAVQQIMIKYTKGDGISKDKYNKVIKNSSVKSDNCPCAADKEKNINIPNILDSDEIEDKMMPSTVNLIKIFDEVKKWGLLKKGKKLAYL